jgi:predicted transcriptional regulator
MQSSTEPAADSSVTRLTGRIVTAYVTNNRIDRLRIGELVTTVHRTLSGLTGGGEGAAAAEATRPAVSPKRSVSPDHIVCLECGMRLKMLKRHLRTHHGMTPQEYRTKWSLAPDYPMVAPNYAARRSDLAREAGLGGARQSRAPRGKRASAA